MPGPSPLDALAARHDVVVVGAGASGAVVAARVSEDPNRSVLLIDAGPDYALLADTPDDLRNGHDNSYVAHDWAYRHLPAAGARETHFPRGRVTGGSSAVNTCIALRGVPEDYDGWAALGNDEWSWDRVLPAFRRLHSSDPRAAPVIESGFGSDERDNERLAQALVEGVRLAQAPPLAELSDGVLWPRLPLDADGARRLAATRAGSGYDPSGTVRMGPPDDPTAVVDQYGRCRAVDQLMVADASLMPFVPRANTNLTSIMIGERMGEWLRTGPARYGL